MKRFLYKDNLNRTTEANNYEPSDFIAVFDGTPGKPIITGPSGFIDASLIPSTPASSLQLSKVASENLTKGDCVYATSLTHVGLATYDSTLDRAMVLGIAGSNALSGENVIVTLLGAVTDPIFSVFSLNRPLYLDELGAITDTKPSNGYLTPVGKSLGSNTIFVSIGYPTKLGA